MKIFTFFVVVIMLLSTQVKSQNILVDGDFSLTTEILNIGFPPPGVWSAYIDAGGSADITIDGGVCNYHVNSPGTDNWMVQLIQAGFILEAGHAYQLTFDVRADADCSFGVFLGENEGSWTSLIGYDRYWQNASTEWQTITLDFNAPFVFPYHKLSFEFGQLDNNTISFDSVILKDMGTYTTTIGIIGTSLDGWDYDFDMETTDDINYTLSIALTEGEVKFRQDNVWNINWGGFDFPAGIGFQDGPNIQVSSPSTYDITFNRETGEYTFTATCPIAGIQCPENITLNGEPDMCGAKVFYPYVIAAADCGGEGISIEQTGGLPSGSFFPVGTTINTFVLTNAAGNTATCSFEVAVSDLPVISGVSETFAPLWPANHKMVNVPINYTSTASCSQTKCSLSVSSNEPDIASGDGKTSPDWVVVDEHNVLLRAERSGNGTGREYYVTITCTNDAGNSTTQVVTIIVPHDNGNKNKSATIGNLDENESFSTNIWPNPSTGSFNLDVRSSSQEQIEISVFDVSGRLISNFKSSDLQFFRFGEDLNPGMYNILIQQGNNRENLKIIKQQ